MTVDAENGETFLKANENRETDAGGMMLDDALHFIQSHVIETIAIER